MTDARRYSAVAMTLHWLIAAMLIANVGLGWVGGDMEGGEQKIQLMQLHKTMGISILLLSLARLAWRLTHRPPVMNSHLKAWEKALAHIVHWGFYVVMIGLPLSGWAMTSASPVIKIYPISFWGLFDWPAIGFISDLPRDQAKSIGQAFGLGHDVLAKALVYVLFPLHVLGALKHQFLDKDGELGRIIPFLPPPKA
ncbi:cytochrome b [Caulobacter sp. SLTY]|uniref:cytochrome b n=1 Tax=Caulobacter sp. SLTY TaxID=2683262 RepID=UPI001411C1FE|nr:cytochrome b [Caulobacter sp. SLTY]NBB15949.1 cytochrome b [Caulobacter sp. SLTY]